MDFFERTKPGDKLRSNIEWALKLVWDTSPGLTLANLAVTVLQSVVPILGLYLTKLIVDAVTVAITGADPAAFRQILILVGLSGGVALLDRALGTVLEYIRTAQTYIA